MLTSDGGIMVKPSYVGACFEPRSPLTGFGGIVVKLKKACCESNIDAWNMAQGQLIEGKILFNPIYGRVVRGSP